MKTIALDEDAYNRLEAYRRSPEESFSEVIKKVVPQHGTLAAVMNFIDARKTNDAEADRLLEQSVEERSSEKSNPWA